MDTSTRAALTDSEDWRLGQWRLTRDLWAPRSDAWLLVHDCGTLVPLTRSEHALVQCLFESPHGGVDNDVLVHAVLQAWKAPTYRPLRTTANIPVVIGRLRAKARRAGVGIPIQRVAVRYCWVV